MEAAKAAEIVRVVTVHPCPHCDSRKTREVGRGALEARPFSLDLTTVVCVCEWCGRTFVAWATKYK